MAGDEWSKENVGKTLEERATQYQNLVGVLRAMDGELKAKIARLIKKKSKGPNPNYSLIDQTSDNYDPSLAREVRDLIKGHYDTNNDLSPLHKAFKKVKGDHYTPEMVANIYHGHRHRLMQSVGQKDFHRIIETTSAQNLEDVERRLQDAASAGYNVEEHGDAVADYLVSEYKVNKKKINVDHLKRQVPAVIGAHVTGTATKDLIYGAAPKYKKKK